MTTHPSLLAHFLDAVTTVWRVADTPDELACCMSAKAVAEALYGEQVVAKAPKAWWALDIQGGAPGPWSTVDAMVEAGISTSVWDPRVHLSLPGMLLRCQGWRGTPLARGVSGHTFDVWIGPRGVIQFDSVISRRYDGRIRLWEDVLKEFPHLRVAQFLPRPAVLS